MVNKDKIEETFLCIAVGLFMAVCIVAIILGDGNKGLLGLF